MFNDLNITVQINEVHDKYSFVVSVGESDTYAESFTVAVSTPCFSSSYDVLMIVPSYKEIYDAIEYHRHLLSIYHIDEDDQLQHFTLWKKDNNSDDWDGIVRNKQLQEFALCKDDFIKRYPELEELLPETPTTPQMVFGVVELEPNETGFYTIKEAVVYPNRNLANNKLKLYRNTATSKYSVFGFQLRHS